jgi:predicted DNA repair protein MutK
VKIDDAGLFLSKKSGADAMGRAQQALGRALLRAAPVLMKLLSVVGTAAMFLVGGGILVHGVPALHHLLQPAAGAVPAGFWVASVAPVLLDAVVGVVAGALVLVVVTVGRKLLRPAH